jgi:hypothetical protein
MEVRELKEYQIQLVKDTPGLSPRRLRLRSQEIMAEIYNAWEEKYNKLEEKYAGCVRAYEQDCR